MPELKQISFAERVLFKIQRIRRDLDNLEDVVLASIDSGEDETPELRRVAVQKTKKGEMK